ncbi:MAG: hypothetical protein HY033_05175 [Ignavibacteriae bacterium]|nr:hypothetical protein [Ignavibacteriota bacterium]
MQLSRDRSITPFFTRKQFLTLSILFLFLIVSTFVVRDLYVNDLSTHWNDIRQAREREVSQEIQSKFSDYERQAFTDVDAIAALSETGHLFSIYDDSTQQAYFFEKVLPLIPADKPIEVYDLDGGLVGWSCTRGPSLDMSKLKRERKSFVLQDPIYSYLTVVVPVFVNDSVQGYVIGRRLIEVNYPINNRFISSRGFAGTFATQLPWPVEFEFLTNTKMLHDSLRIAIEIKNLAGEHVGYGFVSREDLSSQTDLVSLNADHVAELLTVGLLVIILVQIVTLPRIRESVLLHLVAATTALWMLRYFLVWVDFPSAYFQWSIFDPMKFASPFGFGIAKSIGDMFLSAIVLGISVSLITVTYLRTESRAWIARIIRGSKIIAFTLLVGSGLVLAGFIRAFGATIHSAVFDSNLPYNDPAFVLPSLDLTVMLLSMIVIAISFILASMILLSLAWHFSRHLSSRNRSAWLRSGWLVLVFSLIALFFGRLQENPLVTPLERLCYIAGLAIITLLISFVYQKRRQVMSAVSVLGIFLAAVALLVSMLDTKVHALDRVQVELIANEIGRPADSWLTLLVNQSLSELAGPDAATALIDADTVDLQPLAFTQWAKSTLSKEGNNCSITYVNRDEAVVSDFHIGVPPHEYTK